MRLNPNCIKDILLTIELNSNPRHTFNIGENNYKNYHHIKDYSYEEVEYALYKLIECGYIKTAASFELSFDIWDMSFEAHQFLAKAKNPQKWEKFWKVIEKTGELTLPSLFQFLLEQIH